MRRLTAASLLAALCLQTVPARSLEREASAPYRAKRLFKGCWTVTIPRHAGSRWSDGHSTRCFNPGRAVSGFASDAGHGFDFCERWRVDGERLAIHDIYGRAQRCLYAFSEGRRILILRDCPSAGDWRRDDEMTEANRASPNCREQGSPDTDDASDVAP